MRVVLPARRLTAAIAAVLLTGLIGGCNDSGLPSNVYTYAWIDVFDADDTAPRTASDGTYFLVVYDETVTSTDHDIIGARVTNSGDILEYLNIETSSNDDRVPAVAFNGTNYLVVYQETNGAEHNIMGVLVSPSGAVGLPFAIDTSASDDLAPAVASDGAGSLVVYQRTGGAANGDIVGALLNGSGAVQAGSPFPIDVTASNDLVPAAASNGADYLVAFQRVVTGTNSDIRGAVIDPSGPTVTPFGIDTSANDDRAPAVASDGANYLAAYAEVSGTDSDVRGAIVDPSGPAAAPFDIDMTAGVADYAPTVAYGGTDYLVAYTETHTSTNHDIIGARVDSAGTVLTFGFAIDVTGYDDYSPSVAYGPTRYLAAYEEVYSSADHDIFGAVVKP